ncbi:MULTISPECIES: AcrVA2 family anti-CRISPR protein [Pectobacterium]|uniref:AcrVA2 family anti-CRISPR protein n=1 Tax=Pectobacterium TaxID=122277 RepID=UPI0013739910|nr:MULTISPECIES: hypothetical protein [Pectobacterium]QHP82831.1 hypothetical protein EO763_23365 [Pectobacterium odoriferum]
MVQFDKKSHRAREALLDAGRDYPDCWKTGDKLREMNGVGMSWPEWCYLPLGGWYAVVSQQRAGGGLLTSLRDSADVSRLGALGAWRLTQGIYRFDETLLTQLIDTPLGSETPLPSEVLYRLPEWCMYIEMPDVADGVHGFWVHLEHDVNDGRDELRLLVDSDNALYPLILHLGNWTITEAMDRALEEARVQAERMTQAHVNAEYMTKQKYKANEVVLLPALSLLLYICSESAEYSRRGKDDVPSMPRPKKTKRGWRLFPAEGPVEWDVGVRLGAALRQSHQLSDNQDSGTHASPRAHMRRAHWHGFRAGPRKREDGTDIPNSERKFSLKWLPPIPVNVGDDELLPATLRVIK